MHTRLKARSYLSHRHSFRVRESTSFFWRKVFDIKRFFQCECGYVLAPKTDSGSLNILERVGLKAEEILNLCKIECLHSCMRAHAEALLYFQYMRVQQTRIFIHFMFRVEDRLGMRMY